MADKQPVLEAEDLGNGTCRVWCAFCEAYHVHAAEPGHRVAHCHNKSSPYNDGGYVLRLGGEKERAC